MADQQDVAAAFADGIAAAFADMDANGDGTVTATELQLYLMMVGEQVDAEEIEEWFSRIDTDGDGEISLEELRAAIAAFPMLARVFASEENYDPER